MRGVIAASIAVMFAIALITAFLIVGYGHLTTANGPVKITGKVLMVNRVLKTLTINSTSVSVSGYWRCTGINHVLSANELLKMIKPGSNITVIAEHGFIGLKAVKVFLDPGTVCVISLSSPKT